MEQAQHPHRERECAREQERERERERMAFRKKKERRRKERRALTSNVYFHFRIHFLLESGIFFFYIVFLIGLLSVGKTWKMPLTGPQNQTRYLF